MAGHIAEHNLSAISCNDVSGWALHCAGKGSSSSSSPVPCGSSGIYLHHRLCYFHRRAARAQGLLLHECCDMRIVFFLIVATVVVIVIGFIHPHRHRRRHQHRHRPP
eukprot:5704678-Lingulodinium_polyedra.AAC.1